MVNQCCVLRCPSKAKRTTKRFHRFPKDLNICRLWLAVIKHRLATENINRDSVKNLRVCSDHFLPEDYRERSLNNSLNSSAVPSMFPWSLPAPPTPLSSETEVQDCSPKDEPTSDLTVSQSDCNVPPAQKEHSTSASTSSSCTVLARRTRSEARRQKVFSEKENTPTPLSTCSEVEEKSWCKAVKSLQTYQGTNVFQSNEVFVNTRCLLELFQYCSLCQIESCITLEGHDKQFSITQDCQSCGHHREWRSHPTPADQPVEVLNAEPKDPEEAKQEEHTKDKEVLHKEQEEEYPNVKPTPEPVDREANEVEVYIASSDDDEGTEQSCEQIDESYSSSTEEETSELEEQEKKENKKSKKQVSSDEWEPHLDEVAADCDVSMDEDCTLIEDGQGKVVMWCTVCKTDAALSCSLYCHKKVALGTGHR